MTNARGVLASLAAALVIAGCASAGAGGSARGRQDRLTHEQIMAPNVSSLYEVVQRLRPRWLQATGGEPTSMLGQVSAEVLVYQGQMLLGGPDMLRQIAPEMAAELRYLDGPTASATLPGIGARQVSGAIVIYTRSSR